jgi:hydrogenase assembly chaperone HypC/HupF
MCLGTIVQVVETWEQEGAPVGRLDDDRVVSLGFVPGASAGAYVLVHLGIPVEVLDAETAREALALRETARAREEAAR